jgi:hypothetical protein
MALTIDLTTVAGMAGVAGVAASAVAIARVGIAAASAEQSPAVAQETRATLTFCMFSIDWSMVLSFWSI